MTRPVSRSVRTRALARAAWAWETHRYHEAWEILTDAGCGDLWIKFRDEALQRARRRYVRMMSA